LLECCFDEGTWMRFYQTVGRTAGQRQINNVNNV
jgi:hypothetical protein